MIRALIADDERPARRKLRQLLSREPDFEVVGEAADGVEAVAAIQATAPDVVFLDIQMPRLDGFGVIAEVGVEAMPLVVFVTAFDEHALRAFDARALDYLLKPLDPARFDAAVERIKAQWRGRRAGAGAPSPAAAAAAAPALAPTPSAAPVLAPAASGPPAATGQRYLERISVRKGEHIVVVRVAEIDWIHADGNYVRIHAGGTTYLHREALSRLAEALDPAHFLRIHRATLVNLDRIKEIYPLFYGDCQVLLEDGTRLTLSRRFRNQARQVLGLP
jgi:two-component system LytT family response regulator